MSEITYVSRYLGSLSGAGQSGVDVLIALLLTGHSVTVISHTGQRCWLPDQIDGQPIPRPHWITPPRPFPSRIDRQLPRRLAGWLVNLAQDPRWLNELQNVSPPAMTIVNGFSQDLLDLTGQINPRLTDKTAIIVRGSAKEATFQAVGQSVAWAVQVMERYDHLIFVSCRVQQEWLSFPSLADKASFFIPNCCREDIAARLMAQGRAQVRRRLCLPPNQLVGVCVASLQQRKGQDLLLDSFPAFLEAAPDLVLYLIGPISSGWGRALRRKIQASQCRDRLRVLGGKRNAMDYIYSSDVLFLPSRAEALPRVILEAMALKTPVIATDIDGIPELVEHGQSALLFSPAQPAGLVEAFARIAADPDLRRTLAEQAHERYWAHYSRALQIERYRKALKTMLAEPQER